MGGSHFKHKVTFARYPFEQRAAEELRRLQGSLRLQHRLRGDHQVKGGAPKLAPGPSARLGHGRRPSDILGGLAKASGPHVTVLQEDKKLLN